MGFLDSIFGSDSDAGQEKPANAMERARLEKLQATMDNIYAEWKKAFLHYVPLYYENNHTSNNIFQPRGVYKPNTMPANEYKGIVKKAAHDAFDELGLIVGEKVKFHVDSDKVTVYFYYN